MLGVGCLIEAVMLSLLMALSKFYGDGLNKAGSAAGVAFIFLYSALYAVFFNSTLYTIASEIMPTHLRAQGMGVTQFFLNVTGIWLGQVSPAAFAAITWRYYAVFIAVMVVAAVIVFFFVPETNQLSLEDIAVVYGEAVPGGMLKEREHNLMDRKEILEHVEEA